MINHKNQFFYIMIVLCAGYTVSQFLRTSIGVLSPNLMHDFSINPNNMGLLGGVFFLSFAIFQIPGGILIDRYGPRKVMTTIIIFAVLGSIIFALSNSFYSLLIGRILMGIGCSICLMGSLVLITRWADSKQFSKLAGIILAVGGIGGLLATTPLSFFSELYGWKLSFWIAAIITLLVMMLYYFVLEDKTKGLVLYKTNEPISLRNLLFVFKERNFKFMIPLSLMSYSSLFVILGLWGAPYLRDVHGLDVIERGNILMLMAISWNIGSLVFGALRSIFGKNLPKIIIDRNKKVGRPVPFKKWLFENKSEMRNFYSSKNNINRIFQKNIFHKILDNKNPYDRTLWGAWTIHKFLKKQNIKFS